MPSLEELFDHVVSASQARASQARTDATNATNVTEEMLNLMQRQADASIEVGNAQAAEVEAKGAREAAADAERKRIAANLLHPLGADDLASFVGSASAKIAKQKEALDAKRGELVSRMQTKFTDDPLGWLGNAFTLPEDIRAYNAAYQGLTGEQEFVGKVNAALSGTLANQKALEATTSAAETVAQANKAKNMAAVVAMEAQMKGLQASMTGLTVRNSLLAANADSARDVLNAKLAILANYRHDEEMADRRAARKKDAAAEESLNRALPAAFAAFGMDSKQGNTDSWKKLKAVDSDTADAILKFALKLDMVKESKDSEAVAGLRLTATPAEAYGLVLRGVPLQGNGAQAKWLQDIGKRTIAELRNQKFENGAKTFDTLPAKAREEVFNAAFNRNAAYAAMPNAENMQTSPREMQALKLGGTPLAASTPMLAKLFAANPQLADKNFTPEDMMNMVRQDIGVSLVANGGGDINMRAKLLQAYSSELEKLYTAKKQAMFITVQPHLFGTAMDPKAKYAYQFQVPGALFSKSTTADLTRAADIQKILLREAVK